MIKISILGAGGRMGGAVIRAILDSDNCLLAGALARHGAEAVGRDAGELAGAGHAGVEVSEDLAAVLADADVAIDFTLPQATVFNVTGCEAAGCALVIGTTGHSPEQLDRLRQRDWQVPAVLAPNMSIGINVLYRLASLAAAALPGYDAEIHETHHRHKQDAPSGTALRIGEVVAAARDQDFSAVGRLGRRPGDPARAAGEIGISALRAGEIVGDHSLLLAGPGESIEIRHSAKDRGSFANGALEAAAWLRAQRAGLYDMGDVLGLKSSVQ